MTHGWKSRLGDARVIACITVLVAAIVQLSPDLRAALIFDRDAVAQGEGWRMLTATLVHFSWAHLAGDAAVLIPACWLLRDRRGSEVLALFVGASIVGALFVMQLSPELRWYGGLSAVAHAIVVYAALDALGRSGTGRVLAAAALAILAVKLGIDASSARHLSAVEHGVPVLVASMSHLGAVIYAAILFAGRAYGRSSITPNDAIVFCGSPVIHTR